MSSCSFGWLCWAGSPRILTIEAYAAGQGSSLIWIKRSRKIRIPHSLPPSTHERHRHSARLPVVLRGPAGRVSAGWPPSPGSASSARDRSIFRENEPCPGVLVVGQGLVRVFKTGPGGKEHVLHIVGPGDSFRRGGRHRRLPAARLGRGPQEDHLRPAAAGSLPPGAGRRPRTVPRHDDQHDPLGAAAGHARSKTSRCATPPAGWPASCWNCPNRSRPPTARSSCRA